MPDHLSTAARRAPSAALTALTAFCLLLAAAPADAKVKVKTQADPGFDFTPVKTWAWLPGESGDVKTLTTADDDPKAILAKIDPLVRSAVEQEMAKRGLAKAADAAAADVHVAYYVIIAAGSSAQYQGQFLSNYAAWSPPPMSGASTAFTAYEKGSLLLDVIAPALKSAVWRGLAETKVDRQRTTEERAAIIHEGVREMLAKFPPKPGKK